MARRYSHRPLFPNPVVSFFLFLLCYILNGSTLPPSVTFCTARYALHGLVDGRPKIVTYVRSPANARSFVDSPFRPALRWPVTLRQSVAVSAEMPTLQGRTIMSHNCLRYQNVVILLVFFA